MKLKTWMKSVGACNEALEWVGDKTPKRAWAECERADWMAWALARTDIERREVVRINCDFALSVLHLSEDPRAAAAIDATEGWCEGSVDDEALRVAAYAAATAAYAYASARAAASAAAYAAAWKQTRLDALREMADLVRERVDAEWFDELVKEASGK